MTRLLDLKKNRSRSDKEEPEVLYEIRGRGRSWKVWYPDEANLGSPIAVYDKEGHFKETIFVGAPTDKWHDFHEGFVSVEEAKRYIHDLDPDVPEECIKVIRTKTPKETAANARAAKQQKGSE